MMKKLLSLLLTALLVVGMVGCAQQAEAPAEAPAAEGEAAAEGGLATLQRLLMVTGGDAGTYYALGGVLANVLTESVNNLEITATTSGASAANARSLNNGEAELAILQNDVLGYAYEGIDSMAEDGAMPKLRAIAGMYPEVIQLVALKSSNINTIADLKGKKVCVGDAGSGSEVNAKQILEAAGLSYDDFDVQYLSFSDASTAMQNGTVDAAFATSALPNTAIVELANTMRRKLMAYPEVRQVMSQTGRPNDGTDATGFYNIEFHVDIYPEKVKSHNPKTATTVESPIVRLRRT